MHQYVMNEDDTTPLSIIAKAILFVA